MIRGRHRRARLLVTMIAAACAVAARGIAADETPATTARTPATENGINAAKREFEAVKSARDSALQPRTDLPRMSMPELRADSPAPPTPSVSPPKSGVPEKKSANWLLEAMEKKEPPANADRGTKTERETARQAIQNENRQETAQRTETARQAESDRKLNGAPPDPMARFLSDWMTPQDYALLKPGFDQSAKDPTSTMANQLGAALLAIPGADATTGAAGGNVRAPIGGGAPRENPYLTALNLTPPPASPTPTPAFTAPVPPPPAAASPLLAPASPPIAPPKAKVPDFAKPAQDDRYYKQLKRF